MTPDYLSKYTYRIDWSEEDNCFLGRCLEFPSLAAHGDTREEALREIQLVVFESVKWMIEEREELPVPLSIRNYSGKISLRIPPETHKRLSIEAAEEKVSLNQHLTSLLESRQGAVSIKKNVDAVFNKLDRLELVVQRIAVAVSNNPRITLGNWIEQPSAGIGIAVQIQRPDPIVWAYWAQVNARMSNSLLAGYTVLEHGLRSAGDVGAFIGVVEKAGE
jgi:predicted HicB family RNase H-like nuclease